jgi:hypothetical protein
MGEKMLWAVVILTILLGLTWALYQKSLKETRAVSSMFILAVFGMDFREAQSERIMEYLKSITAKDAMEVSQRFAAAADITAVKMAYSPPPGSQSTLLLAQSFLWMMYKDLKKEHS